MTISAINRAQIYEQSMSYRTQATGGEIVDIVFHKNRPVDLFVEHNGKRMQVEPYFVPNELKQGPFDTALLKAAYFSVSHFKEGGCRVDFNLRLRGGMMGEERSLALRDGYGELVDSVNRELMKVPICRFSVETRTTIEVGTSAVGALAGARAGYNSYGLKGAAIGGLTAGFAALLATNACTESLEEPAKRAQSNVDTIYRYFTRATEYLERLEKTKAYEEARKLKEYLRESEYISQASTYGIDINETKFRSIQQYFNDHEKLSAIVSLKCIIFSTLAILPRGECPLDSLIDSLVDLVSADGISSPVRYRCYAVIGRLFVNKGVYDKALQWFEAVPSNSDVYGPVQKIIPSIRSKLQQFVQY